MGLNDILEIHPAVGRNPPPAAPHRNRAGASLVPESVTLADGKPLSISAFDAINVPRHRWFFFKEAFSPDVVDKAIADTGCGPNDIVIDPFSGSGTVALQSAIREVTSTGLEVNPFLAFVSKTKVSSCAVKAFEAAAEAVLKPARRGRASRLAGFSTFSEPVTREKGPKKWLFNRAVLQAFEGAWQAVGTSDTASQRMVKLCLLGAANDVCNAVKDGKALRYRSDWEEQSYSAADFIAAFEVRVADIAEDLVLAPDVGSRATIRLGDARRKAPAEGFKLCVTSPPYLNSFDYTDVYRPELFLGGWVTDMAGLRRLRLRTIRSHVQVKWNDPKTDGFGAHYTESVKRLGRRKSGLWNARIPLMVQAYFEDMKVVLTNLRKAAAPNASTWMVVSTSAYAGVEIPVDLILADIGSTCGWYLREVSVIRYLGQVAGQQWKKLASQDSENLPHLRESLIIFDAAPR